MKIKMERSTRGRRVKLVQINLKDDTSDRSTIQPKSNGGENNGRNKSRYRKG
jgi:hypothetical protein